MRLPSFKSLFVSSLMSCAALGASVAADSGPIVKDGDRVAIVGDSITEQKLYSKFMEAYLLACTGIKDVKVFQFGWGGEKAPGFVARMENDAYPWSPTVVTTCYGMNDGGYRQYDEKAVGEPYRQSMEKIVKAFKEKGVKVVVGAPGVVDSKTYTRGCGAKVYNENLGELAKLDKAIAAENGEAFADVHSAMVDAMAKAKAALGDAYPVAGGDGVHPGANGHLVMAYAFLKAMGFDGRIASIEIDWNGKAAVSEGHKILEQAKGSVEIESSRYPFCHFGDEKDANGTVSILPFVPFQNDLNRFELKVKNLPGAKAEIDWGGQKKTFSREELEKGVNLSSEFVKNPFSEQFGKLLAAITAKQAFETTMIKSVISNFRAAKALLGDDPDAKKIDEAISMAKEKLFAKQAKLDANVHAELVPVKHKISVTPVK